MQSLNTSAYERKRDCVRKKLKVQIQEKDQPKVLFQVMNDYNPRMLLLRLA